MAAILAVSAGTEARGAGQSRNPIEIGTVDWRRDFEAALVDTERSGKPVFAFFQEVPGCSGCRKFGADVMSHPAIVQAVQEEFIPVLIYNNRRGKDAALLRRYDEPAWNYQVVRFLDGNGTDLIPRKDRVWTTDALALRMARALEAAGRSIPGYLEVVAYENDTKNHATVAFAQHCFWTGEFELGQIRGVISTEAGWLEGREVVLLRYHRNLLSVKTLVEKAGQTDSADKIYLTTQLERERVLQDGRMTVGTLDDSYKRADASDQKRQIRKSVFDKMNLSPMQQTKVNSFAPISMDRALSWLTTLQRREFERLSGPSR